MRVIWINGPFGVGKTTVAEAMTARWPSAILYDPELVGALLRRILPRDESPPDFQDIPIWRALVKSIALDLLTSYQRPLVVPMTLFDPDYFDEIVGGLRREGVTVEHFALLARPTTILDRIRESEREEWAAEHLPRCLEALADPRFGQQIVTDGKSINAIVDEIQSFIGDT